MNNYSFIHLKMVDSTNAYLLEKPESERVGTVAWANRQTAGKGMGSNTWESAPGLNLTFSMGIETSFLEAKDQFLLSQAVPLGLLDALDSLLPAKELSVKWPNDLYYGSRKLCGILINSTIHGTMMGVSVVGIGLNVNQLEFHDWPTHPISMKMILGRDVALEPLLHQLVEAVDQKVHLLKSEKGVAAIKEAYLKRLYRYRIWSDYEVNGKKVRRFIVGIDPFGRLETLDEANRQCVYDIKEIKFLNC